MKKKKKKQSPANLFILNQSNSCAAADQYHLRDVLLFLLLSTFIIYYYRLVRVLLHRHYYRNHSSHLAAAPPMEMMAIAVKYALALPLATNAVLCIHGLPIRFSIDDLFMRSGISKKIVFTRHYTANGQTLSVENWRRRDSQ